MLWAIIGIAIGIMGILAAVFKWEWFLFKGSPKFDLDDAMWYRVLNGAVGAAFIVFSIYLLIFY